MHFLIKTIMFIGMIVRCLCLKIVTHMANTRHSQRKCWTCKLCGSWNWWWRKLEWRGPHRGWPEAHQSVDFGWKVAVKMEGHGQRALSPVLFCFTPHTHAHCPSIAYWITSNQSIKVTWRRSLHCLNRLTGRCINGCLCSFSWEVKKTRCLKCCCDSHPSLQRQLGEAPSWIYIKHHNLFCPSHSNRGNLMIVIYSPFQRSWKAQKMSGSKAQDPGRCYILLVLCCWLCLLLFDYLSLCH